MKKEFLKGFTMFVLILTLALATAVVSANAQSSSVSADIPFEFVVGGKSMPSGEYTLHNASADSAALSIQRADGKKSVLRLTNSIQGKRSDSRLVFHRYGQTYFLAEVWKAGDTTGRQLLKSRQERAIERELASISPKGEPGQGLYEIVEVAAGSR